MLPEYLSLQLKERSVQTTSMPAILRYSISIKQVFSIPILFSFIPILFYISIDRKWILYCSSSAASPHE